VKRFPVLSSLTVVTQTLLAFDPDSVRQYSYESDHINCSTYSQIYGSFPIKSFDLDFKFFLCRPSLDDFLVQYKRIHFKFVKLQFY
jgi:hypothetical protein